jgi:hypothetical protein
MTVKNHDEIFAELCKEFPGLMDYLLDGHLEEVSRLTEKVRFLNNEMTSSTARLQEAAHEASTLAMRNHEYENLIRRVGMMIDSEALKNLVDTDLVPCGLPVTVALDLATASRPFIVAQGEKELTSRMPNEVALLNEKFDPSIFALHQDGKVSDSTMLKMVMGLDPGLAKDETVVAPVVKQKGPLHPGVFIEQAGRLKSFAVEYMAEPRPDMTMVNLRNLADALLARFGWACIDVSVNGRGNQGISIEVVAKELDGIATSIDASAFEQEFRAEANRMLPVSCYIDEIVIRSSRGGRPVLMPAAASPSLYAVAAGKNKKVKW